MSPSASRRTEGDYRALLLVSSLLPFDTLGGSPIIPAYRCTRPISRMIRPQYFFRQSDQGLLAWDIRRLIDLSRRLPIEQVSLADVAELDETYWYEHEGSLPTCRSLLGHMNLIDQVDTSFPIILDQDGRVMDGMHRVCKAVRDGREQLPAVRFETTPDPDYVGINPGELPYDE